MSWAIVEGGISRSWSGGIEDLDDPLARIRGIKFGAFEQRRQLRSCATTGGSLRVSKRRTDIPNEVSCRLCCSPAQQLRLESTSFGIKQPTVC